MDVEQIRKKLTRTRKEARMKCMRASDSICMRVYKAVLTFARLHVQTVCIRTHPSYKSAELLTVPASLLPSEVPPFVLEKTFHRLVQVVTMPFTFT